MRTPIIVIVAVLVLLGGAVALSRRTPSTDSSASPSTTTTSEPNTIVISNYMFEPAAMTIKKGTTITWKNTDTARHTVTADTASADAPSSQLFGQGETYAFTFNQVGTYSYHCEPHPYMKATITVTE